jgi:hypothetical protein
MIYYKKAQKGGEVRATLAGVPLVSPPFFFECR